jgi:hypothetical protein
MFTVCTTCHMSSSQRSQSVLLQVKFLRNPDGGSSCETARLCISSFLQARMWLSPTVFACYMILETNRNSSIIIIEIVEEMLRVQLILQQQTLGVDWLQRNIQWRAVLIAAMKLGITLKEIIFLVHERFLRCDALWSGRWVQTLLRNLLPLSSGKKTEGAHSSERMLIITDKVKTVLNGISRVENIFPLMPGFPLIKVYYDNHGIWKCFRLRQVLLYNITENDFVPWATFFRL